MLLKRSLLEKVGGYDRGLGYGEDTDLVKRLQETDYRHSNVDAKEHHTLVTSLSDVYSQGRWYGKGMPNFFRKHPEETLSLLSMLLFVTLPIITIGAILHRYMLYLAIPQHLIVFLYVASAYYNTRSPYAFVVPIVKVVRSYGEIIGLFEGLFTEDLGRE